MLTKLINIRFGALFQRNWKFMLSFEVDSSNLCNTPKFKSNPYFSGPYIQINLKKSIPISLQTGFSSRTAITEEENLSELSIKAEEAMKTADYVNSTKYYRELIGYLKNKYPNGHAQTAEAIFHYAFGIYELGKLQDALILFQESLDIWRKIKKEDHHGTAQCLDWIGAILFHLGKHEEALNSIEKALEIFKTSLKGQKDHELAICIMHKAMIIANLGDLDVALKIYNQALDMLMSLQPDGSVSIAAAHSNIANLHYLRQAYNEALDHLEKSYFIFKKVSPVEKPQLAIALNGKGNVYAKLGKFQEGISTFHEALRIWDKVYKGLNHPDVAATLLNLGVMYMNAGKIEEALKYVQDSATMSLHVYGKEHPRTKSAETILQLIQQKINSKQEYEQAKKNSDKGNLSLEDSELLYKAALDADQRGDLNESVDFFQRALKGYRSIFKEDNEKIAATLHGLGLTLGKWGRIAEGVDRLKQALEIFQHLHKGDHLRIANIKDKIGVFSTLLGNVEEGKKFTEEAIEMLTRLPKSTENSHVLAQAKIHNGVAFNTLKKDIEARNQYLEAVEIFKTLHEHGHPDYARALMNLGITEQNLGNLKEAVDYFDKSYKMMVSTFKREDPDMARCLMGSGYVLNKLGRIKEAIENLETASIILKKIFGESHSQIGNVSYLLGAFQAQNGLYEEGLKNLLTSVSIFEKHMPELPALKEIYGLISRVFSKLGNKEKSEEFLVKSES